MHLSNGFNGPSITAAWLAYVLATHPDVEEKLIAEIDGITGGDPDYDLQYDDLMALTYTTQVIKETMRVYPPMPITIRRSLKDGTLGRYRVRRGNIVLVGTLRVTRPPAGSGSGRRARVGTADREPGNERLRPSRDRVRQQLRREQGAGRALRRAERLPRLHQRGDDAGPARRVAVAAHRHWLFVAVDLHLYA